MRVKVRPGRVEIRRAVPFYVDLPLVLAALAGLFLFFGIAARPTQVTCDRGKGTCELRTAALEAHSLSVGDLRSAKVQSAGPGRGSALVIRGKGQVEVEFAQTPWVSRARQEALAEELRAFARARAPERLDLTERSWLLAVEVGGAFCLLALLGLAFRRRWFRATVEVTNGALHVQRRDLLSTAHAPVLQAGAAALEEERSDDGRRIVLLLPEGRRLALTPWVKNAAELAQVRAEVGKLLGDPSPRERGNVFSSDAAARARRTGRTTRRSD